jgi:hypothetical protein
MAEAKEIKGTFKYERDSKRYHRFRIENKEGITGTIYIPKDMDPLPERIILDQVKKD